MSAPDLAAIEAEAIAAVRAAASVGELEGVRARVLGKKSALQDATKAIGTATAKERPTLGKRINDARAAVAAAIEARRAELSAGTADRLAEAQWIDVTEPGTPFLRGSLHPVTQVQYELEDIFTAMGFMVADGPEVETEYYNFEALNVPAHHPARDMQDTFWLTDGNLMRTHTSPVQVRMMEKHRPPIRTVVPGRVFRYEATDASHDNTFYQMEGLVVDRDISVAHLTYTMRVLLREIFARDVTIRLRPGYFPFVEPGFELDMLCLICGGPGCSVCKRVGWVEVLPCGLVHPRVLAYGGIDPGAYSGFAFGLGLSRLAMLRYQVNDIRHLLSGDLRFARQF
ncbi:MAG: phenylalanine--tRNA ligase subunit alpha [Acidobacteriota bacterium]